MKYFVFLFVAVGITGVVFGYGEGGATATEEGGATATGEGGATANEKGGATATEEGGEPLATLPTECPWEADADGSNKKRLGNLVSEIFDCIDNPRGGFPLIYELRGPKTKEELLATVKGFCDKGALIPNCMAEIYRVSEICLNATQHDSLKINSEFIQNIRQVICEDEGAKLVDIVHVARSLNISRESISKCMDDGVASVGTWVEHDVALFSLQQYRVADFINNCTIENLGADTPIGVEINSLVSAILSKSHCINEGGEKVLCQTLNP